MSIICLLVHVIMFQHNGCDNVSTQWCFNTMVALVMCSMLSDCAFPVAHHVSEMLYLLALFELHRHLFGFSGSLTKTFSLIHS